MTNQDSDMPQARGTPTAERSEIAPAASAWSILAFAGLGPLIGAFAMPVITMAFARIAWIPRWDVLTYHELFRGLRYAGPGAIYMFGFLPALVTGVTFCWVRHKGWTATGAFPFIILFGFMASLVYWKMLFAIVETGDHVPDLIGIAIGLTGAIAAAACQLLVLTPRALHTLQRQIV